jgi:hypothetical protein
VTSAAEGTLKRAVSVALDSVLTQFDADRVRSVPDGQGGAWVEIVDEPLGEAYSQDATFVIALLPFNLPNADVYPIFLRPDLSRVDGAGLGEGFQVTAVQLPGDAATRPAVQVSRRTRGDFHGQSAAQKITKVLEWVRQR